MLALFVHDKMPDVQKIIISTSWQKYSVYTYTCTIMCGKN